MRSGSASSSASWRASPSRPPTPDRSSTSSSRSREAMKLGLVLELAIVLCGVTAPAHAETKRFRISVDALPRQDSPVQVSARDAVLPDGAREGAPVPKSWKVATRETPQEAGHCTD